MSEMFQNILDNYPNAVKEKDGVMEIDYALLMSLLVDEISDLKDQLNEKDYQVTKIFERLERLAELV